MLKKVLILLVFFLLPAKVFAADPPKFSVSYDITYAVAETSLTTVTQNIHLTNLTSEYYASEYTSRIGTAQIQNLRAFDKLGQLGVFTSLEGDERQAKITFNDQIYGKGKTLNWTLAFESAEIARKNGRIWEINIPKPSSLENIDQYNVTLVVPSSFKNPLYLKPQPQTNYYWTKNQIQNAGISVAFGDFQIFNYNFTYHLSNPNFYPLTQEITLPPDTQYQKVFLSNLDPKPLDVVVDADGNWLAKYFLNPRQNTVVVAQGQAQIFLKPQKESEQVSDLNNYLLPQKYWEVNDDQIKNTAQSLTTPQNIYNFVANLLTYDISRVDKNLPRLGAKAALTNPQSAICMEFTDLFIALARAADIPTRQLSGFAYTQNNKNSNHAWAQYYDRASQTWKMVDPTWGKTTGGTDYFTDFDLNHFVLAINGTSPLKPLPPGSSEVSITFQPTEISQNPASVAAIEITNNTLYLKNNGSTFLEISEINLSAANSTVSPSHLEKIALPPFAVRKIPLDLKPKTQSLRQNDTITVESEGHVLKFNVKINSLYDQAIVAIILFAILLASTAIFILAKKSGHLCLFRR